MKAYIKIVHDGKEYISQPAELSNDEIEILENVCQNLVSGKLTYFQITNDDGSITFFGKEILAKSVITLIKYEDK